MPLFKRNPGVSGNELYQLLLQSSSTPIHMPAIKDTITHLYDRRGKGQDAQIASLLRAVTCLDLTTLCGDDTCSNVQRLCFKAESPIQHDLLFDLGIDPTDFHVGAVCVYPSKVRECVKILKSLGSSVRVAAVAAGFPSGQYHLNTRLDEIRHCVNDGAKEIDIVINRDLALCGKWEQLFEEVKAMKEACGDATLKTIVAAGELGSFNNVYKASLVCMAAGADFIKTSTGKESVNATLAIGMVMARAILDYYHETGYRVGFKPAGGVRNAKDVLSWQELMMHELGSDWLYPDLFRIGASALLVDIEENIFNFVTGCSGSKHMFPYQ